MRESSRGAYLDHFSSLLFATVDSAGSEVSAMTSLPAFERPPVSEVALAVQFEPLDVGSVNLARLADALEGVQPGHKIIRERIPEPPLPPRASERTVRINVTEVPEPPLIWLLDETQHNLIQLQVDRLVVNWRKLLPDDPYPRFESIRSRFESAWERLQERAEKLGIGLLHPNACEVTYFNGIDIGGELATAGHVETLIAPWTGQTSEPFLGKPSEVRITARYPLPRDLGFLSIELEPAERLDTGEEALLMRVGARGWPETPDRAGVLEFFELAHEWIVRGFTSFTNPTMHTIWGRDQ